MYNFEYYTPTRVVFGKNSEKETGRYCGGAVLFGARTQIKQRKWLLCASSAKSGLLH